MDNRKCVVLSEIKILKNVIDRVLIATGYSLDESRLEVIETNDRDFEITLRLRVRRFDHG